MSSTSYNPNVLDKHLSYFAQFDLDKDNALTHKLKLKSSVTQNIHMSAYLYDRQHVGNGECSEYKYSSDA
jgi:hypothetical protein